MLPPPPKRTRTQPPLGNTVEETSAGGLAPPASSRDRRNRRTATATTAAVSTAPNPFLPPTNLFTPFQPTSAFEPFADLSQEEPSTDADQAPITNDEKAPTLHPDSDSASQPPAVAKDEAFTNKSATFDAGSQDTAGDAPQPSTEDTETEPRVEKSEIEKHPNGDLATSTDEYMEEPSEKPVVEDFVADDANEANIEEEDIAEHERAADALYDDFGGGYNDFHEPSPHEEHEPSTTGTFDESEPYQTEMQDSLNQTAWDVDPEDAVGSFRPTHDDTMTHEHMAPEELPLDEPETAEEAFPVEDISLALPLPDTPPLDTADNTSQHDQEAYIASEAILEPEAVEYGWELEIHETEQTSPSVPVAADSFDADWAEDTFDEQPSVAEPSAQEAEPAEVHTTHLEWREETPSPLMFASTPHSTRDSLPATSDDWFQDDFNMAHDSHEQDIVAAHEEQREIDQEAEAPVIQALPYNYADALEFEEHRPVEKMMEFASEPTDEPTTTDDFDAGWGFEAPSTADSSLPVERTESFSLAESSHIPHEDTKDESLEMQLETGLESPIEAAANAETLVEQPVAVELPALDNLPSDINAHAIAEDIQPSMSAAVEVADADQLFFGESSDFTSPRATTFAPAPITSDDFFADESLRNLQETPSIMTQTPVESQQESIQDIPLLADVLAHAQEEPPVLPPTIDIDLVSEPSTTTTEQSPAQPATTSDSQDAEEEQPFCEIDHTSKKVLTSLTPLDISITSIPELEERASIDYEHHAPLAVEEVTAEIEMAPISEQLSSIDEAEVVVEELDQQYIPVEQEEYSAPLEFAPVVVAPQPEEQPTSEPELVPEDAVKDRDSSDEHINHETTEPIAEAPAANEALSEFEAAEPSTVDDAAQFAYPAFPVEEQTDVAIHDLSSDAQEPIEEDFTLQEQPYDPAYTLIAEQPEHNTGFTIQEPKADLISDEEALELPAEPLPALEEEVVQEAANQVAFNQLTPDQAEFMFNQYRQSLQEHRETLQALLQEREVMRLELQSLLLAHGPLSDITARLAVLESDYESLLDNAQSNPELMAEVAELETTLRLYRNALELRAQSEPSILPSSISDSRPSSDNTSNHAYSEDLAHLRSELKNANLQIESKTMHIATLQARVAELGSQVEYLKETHSLNEITQQELRKEVEDAQHLIERLKQEESSASHVETINALQQELEFMKQAQDAAAAAEASLAVEHIAFDGTEPIELINQKVASLALSKARALADVQALKEQTEELIDKLEQTERRFKIEVRALGSQLAEKEAENVILRENAMSGSAEMTPEVMEDVDKLQKNHQLVREHLERCERDLEAAVSRADELEQLWKAECQLRNEIQLSQRHKSLHGDPNGFQQKYNESSAALTEAQSKIVKLEELRVQKQEHIEKLEQDVKKLNKIVEQLEAKNREAQRQVSRQADVIDDLRQQIGALERESAARSSNTEAQLNETVAERDLTIRDLELELDSFRARNDELAGEVSTLKNTLGKLERRAQQLKANSDESAKESESVIAALRAENDKLQREISLATQSSESYNEEKSALLSDLEALQKELEQARSEFTRASPPPVRPDEIAERNSQDAALIEELSTELQVFRTQLEESQVAHTSDRERIHSLEELLSTSQQEQDALKNQLDSAKQTTDSYQKTLSEKEADLSALNARLAAIDITLPHTPDNVVASLETELESRLGEIERLKQELDDLKTAANVQTRDHNGSLEQQVEHLKAENADLMTSLEKAESLFATASNDNQELENKVKALESTLEQRQTTLEQLQLDLSAAKNLEEAHVSLVKEVSKLNEELALSRKAMSDLESQLDLASTQLDATRQELDSRRELTAEHDKKRIQHLESQLHEAQDVKQDLEEKLRAATAVALSTSATPTSSESATIIGDLKKQLEDKDKALYEAYAAFESELGAMQQEWASEAHPSLTPNHDSTQVIELLAKIEDAQAALEREREDKRKLAQEHADRESRLVEQFRGSEASLAEALEQERLEKDSVASEMRSLVTAIEAKDQEVAILRTQLATALEAANHDVASINDAESAKAQVKELEEELKSVSAALVQAESAQTQVIELQEELRSVSSSLEQAELLVEQQRETLTSMQKEAHGLIAQNETLQAQYSALKEEPENPSILDDQLAERDLVIARLEAELQRHKDAALESQASAAVSVSRAQEREMEAKNNEEKLYAQIRDLKDSLQQLTEKNTAQEQQMESMREAHLEAVAEIRATMQDKIENLEKDLSAAQLASTSTAPLLATSSSQQLLPAPSMPSITHSSSSLKMEEDPWEADPWADDDQALVSSSPVEQQAELELLRSYIKTKTQEIEHLKQELVVVKQEKEELALANSTLVDSSSSSAVTAAVVAPTLLSHQDSKDLFGDDNGWDDLEFEDVSAAPASSCPVISSHAPQDTSEPLAAFEPKIQVVVDTSRVDELTKEVESLNKKLDAMRSAEKHSEKLKAALEMRDQEITEITDQFHESEETCAALKEQVSELELKLSELSSASATPALSMPQVVSTMASSSTAYLSPMDAVAEVSASPASLQAELERSKATIYTLQTLLAARHSSGRSARMDEHSDDEFAEEDDEKDALVQELKTEVQALRHVGDQKDSLLSNLRLQVASLQSQLTTLEAQASSSHIPSSSSPSHSASSEPLQGQEEPRTSPAIEEQTSLEAALADARSKWQDEMDALVHKHEQQLESIDLAHLTQIEELEASAKTRSEAAAEARITALKIALDKDLQRRLHEAEEVHTAQRDLLETKLAQVTTELRTTEQQISDLRLQLQTLTAQNTNLLSAVESLKNSAPDAQRLLKAEEENVFLREQLIESKKEAAETQSRLLSELDTLRSAQESSQFSNETTKESLHFQLELSKQSQLDAESKCAAAHTKLQEMVAALEQVKAEVRVKSDQLQQRDVQITDLQTRMNTEKSSREHSLMSAEEDALSLRDENSRLKTQLEQSRKTVQGLRIKQEEQDAQIGGLKEEDKKNAEQVKLYLERIEQLQGLLDKPSPTVSWAEEQLISQAAIAERLTSENLKLSRGLVSGLIDQQTPIERLAAAKTHLQDRVDRLEKDLKRMKSELSVRTEERDSLRTKVDALSGEKTELKRQLSTASASRLHSPAAHFAALASSTSAPAFGIPSSPSFANSSSFAGLPSSPYSYTSAAPLAFPPHTPVHSATMPAMTSTI